MTEVNTAVNFKQVLPKDLPQRLQFNAGLVLKRFDIAAPTAYTEADIFGVTSGGITISCVPTIVDEGAEIDGAKANTDQLQNIQGYEVTVETTFVTGGADDVSTLVGYAEVTSSEEGAAVPYKKITPKEGLVPASAFADIWVVGKQGTGQMWAVNIKKAMSTAGFSKQTANNAKNTMAATLKGFYDLNEMDDSPVEFYEIGTAPVEAAPASAPAEGEPVAEPTAPEEPTADPVMDGIDNA